MKNKSIYKEELGASFCILGSGICLNLEKFETLEENVRQKLGAEYIGVFNHEQYFYHDYYAYQPDFEDKLYLAARLIKDAGYTFVNADLLN